MTNSGDFRRYSYSTDASYALKAFDVQRSSAAPSYVPSPSRRRNLRVRENEKPRKKSGAQLRREQREGFRWLIRIGTVSVLSLALLFGIIYNSAQKNELTHEISQLETDLAVAESENTRITSELDSLVSMSMIDQYAVEKLGMTKVKSNQIRYIDVSEYKEKRLAAAQMLLEKTEESQSADSDAAK